MKFNNRENEKVYTDDGRTVWLSRSPAVAVVIVATINFEDPRVLTVIRGSGVNNTGKTCLPCGYLDWDESGPEGAMRELYEETNINLTEMLEVSDSYSLYWGEQWYINTNPAEDDLQNITLYYGVHVNFKSEEELPKLSGENAAPNEVESVFWSPRREVGLYDWAFNHEKRIEKFYSWVNL